MLKDKLQIVIITHNRINYLKRTFEQILSDNSPIKEFDITVLDNASTDGSSELIDEYCTKFPNLKHIRHKINIGGNANICRAFELGTASGKEYVWVLCDDDKYDFSHWSRVEEEIKNKTDIICVSNYAFKNPNCYNLKEYQIFQLTFVPAGIYRTELIDDTVLTNMYDAIFTMFQQCCIFANAIQKNKKVTVLENPIVNNGIFYQKYSEQEISLTRGYDGIKLKRRQKSSWMLGYAGILTLFDNPNFRGKCIEIAAKSDNIHGGLIHFFYFISTKYKMLHNLHFLAEIYNSFNFKLKTLYLLYLITLFIPNCIIYCRKTPNGRVIKLFGKQINKK